MAVKNVNNSSINEFIDWISGVNKITNITDKKDTIGGGAIRELLQNHIINPFIVHKDDDNNRKLLFSSEASYKIWANARKAKNIKTVADEATLDKKYKDLVLLEFDIPPAHTLSIGKAVKVPLSQLYLLDKGDNSKVSGNIEFVYYIDNGDGSILSEADITISVIDISTNRTKATIARHQDSEFSNGSTSSKFDISDYLTTGKNRFDIKIHLTGDVNTNDIDTSFFVNVIQFNLSLIYTGSKSFNNPYLYQSGQSQNEYVYEPLAWKISCYKSISETCSLKITSKIDGELLNDITDSAWQGQSITKDLEVNPNQYLASYIDANNVTHNIKHTLLITAEITTEDSHIFKSNLLYYTFENKAYDAETQSDLQIENTFINIGQSIAEEKTNSKGEHILVGYQYNKFTLKWGYYTDGTNLNAQINWKIHKKGQNETTYVPNNDDVFIATLKGNSGKSSDDLIFIPERVFTEGDNAYLIATITKNSVEHVVYEQPIIIYETKFDRVFNEYSGYALKLNAYGRSNNESEESKRTWEYNGITTTFSNKFPFDGTNGWNNNALCFSGESTYATVNFNAFIHNNTNSLKDKGRAIEIDFKTTNVYNENDELMVIGNKYSNNAHIIVYPSKTVFYNAGKPLLTTNYKSNERIQLTFLIMHQVSNNPNSQNIYIVNNGILERGASVTDYGTLGNSNSENAIIKMGGANSGIMIYNMRVWYNDMTLENNGVVDMNIAVYHAFLNYLFDAENKTAIISRNEVTNGSTPDPFYTACSKRIDTLLIESDDDRSIDQVFNTADKDKSTAAVNIEYTSTTDSSLGFTASNVRIRKHGQSTLNYPITSLKIWLNKSVGENNTPKVSFKPGWMLDDIYKVKNRYAIKPGNIPANKFVLQANYADSSGVHNGGLLRLINDTWYNANFGTLQNPIYRLRTAPQLFSSGQLLVHDEHDPNIPHTSWTEGYGNTNKVFGGLKASEHTWPELAKAFKGLSETPIFKYKIRNAPDSLPCVVFYRRDANTAPTYLGQFVLMDDKKSDHIFGERSIYLWDDIYDPFCMTDAGANTMVENSDGEMKKGYDRDANCCWENKNVLRIECVLLNTSLTSFMSTSVAESVEVDEDGNVIGGVTGDNQCTSKKYETDKNGQQYPVNYYWEDYFELIYPDEDDIEEDGNLTKFSGRYKTKEESNNPNYVWPENTSKFIKKTQPWIDFLYWICGIGELNKNKTTGEYNIDGTVSDDALDEFIRTAPDHLDLYKLAAYYIFFIRFGLVDSVERNAQFKTYDGQHWFCEPWDMDIALGNKNTGGLVYNPPMNRDTMLDETGGVWAYSGRSTSTSNVLWDCLEKWTYWTGTIVPDTAAALYNGGLTYDNICQVFDEDYANKWSELLYNNSGLYKYVTAAQEKKWLGWLQGSRMTHRHWWISTSMNYYDSKWTCGQFNESRIYLAVNKAQGSPAEIKVYPITSTFFKLTQKDTTTNLGLKEATPENPAIYDLTPYSFAAKDPAHLFGALFIEKLYFGEFARGFDKLIFQNAVDKVTGPTIKVFSIGYDVINSDSLFIKSDEYTGWFNSAEIGISRTASISSLDNDASLIDPLLNVETYNATGQLSITSGDILQDERTRIKNVYAAGTSVTEFKSSSKGNSFDILQLPASNITKEDDVIVNSITSITMTDSSWNDISFWNCKYPKTVQTEELKEKDPETGDMVSVLDDNGNPIRVKVDPKATYTKRTRIVNGQTVNDIPLTLKQITFDGSTCQNKCSIQFILNWFACIENDVRSKNPSLSGDDLETEILRVISDPNTGYKAELDNIRWNYQITNASPDYVSITYKDVIRLGHLNAKSNQDNHMKGYIKIEGNEMSPFQLRELMELFGDNVFNISAIDNNVVIDQAQEYSRITVSGRNIEIENDNIYIKEGVAVNFKCTNFLLTNETADSYDWYISGGSGAVTGYSGGDAQSGYAYYTVTFNESKAGLSTDKYTVTIQARNKQDSSKQASLTLYVIPVTITDDWELIWQINNKSNGAREFICNDIVAEQLFGAIYVSRDARGNRPPIYVLPHGNFDGDLVIRTNTDFNVSLDSINYTFNVINGHDLVKNQALTINNIEPINSNTWTDEVKSYDIATVNGEGKLIKVSESTTDTEKPNPISYQTYAGGNKKIRNSIRIQTYSADNNGYAYWANEIRLITMQIAITYKSASIPDPTYYRCNFILYNDNNPIISSSSLLGQSLIYHLNKTYSPITNYYNTVQYLYKTDMMSLVGDWDGTYKPNNDEIKISDTGPLNILNGTTSIFDYCTNLTGIDLSSITFTVDSYSTISNGILFDFDKLKSLTKLNLNNCGQAAAFNVDLKSSPKIEEVHLQGTRCDITAVRCPALVSLDLGSPVNIDIEDCALLNDTKVTCQSVSRINSQNGSITLKNLNSATTYVFRLFNKIYDPNQVQSN